MKSPFIAVVACALALSGCAVGVSQVQGPQGRTAYSLKCAGYMRTIEDCYTQAGKICPTGYKIETQPMVDPTGGAVMLITCS